MQMRKSFFDRRGKTYQWRVREALHAYYMRTFPPQFGLFM